MALPKVLRITHSTDNVTIINDDQIATAKDIAINKNLEDLASARGQIGNNIRINTASDLNTYTKAGNWLFSDAAAGENFPNVGRGGELNCYVSTTAIFQFFTEFNNNRRYIRYGIPNSTWTNWIQFISVAQLGDGIRTTQGIISVPEYEGATESSSGTSGLVPPAAAGQQNHLLTGGGTYISKIPSATHADTADNSLALSGRPWLESLYTDSAGWVIGSVDEKLRPVNTGSLKVLAAERIHSSSFYYGRTATGFSLPNGGSWFIFSILDNDLSHGSENAVPTIVAGGTAIGWSYNGTGYTWIGIKVL
jgi:hypothetical protein